MPAPSDDLDLLKHAARESARIALGYFGQKQEVFWKEGNSPVGEADLAVDGYLRDFLLSSRPRYGWVSEETASEPGRGEDPRFFVVDPIDGTRSFLRGETTWCVALAVIDKARPATGVIEVPVTGESYSATRDGGAALNGAPCRVSAPRPGERLRLSLPDRMRAKIPAEELAEFELATPIPSLAYRLARVADGRLDGTIVLPRANDWDIAAADLILEQAGGTLINLRGERHLYKLNPARHGLLIAGADHALDRLRHLAAALTA